MRLAAAYASASAAASAGPRGVGRVDLLELGDRLRDPVGLEEREAEGAVQLPGEPRAAVHRRSEVERRGQRLRVTELHQHLRTQRREHAGLPDGDLLVELTEGALDLARGDQRAQLDAA